MKKNVMRAPVLSQSGYGEHARFVLRSLRQFGKDLDIYIINISWGQTSWLWEDSDERKWIDGEVISAQHEKTKNLLFGRAYHKSNCKRA